MTNRIAVSLARINVLRVPSDSLDDEDVCALGRLDCAEGMLPLEDVRGLAGCHRNQRAH
jgi:hypothetical protein